MFEFELPIGTNKNKWKLCFKDREEMNKIYFENRPVDEEVRVYGVTEYITQTIYIDKDLDGFILGKTLRHELTHIYLWETGQQDRVMNEEEVSDLIGVAAPMICKCVDNIMFRLKEGLYKRGE